jgi:hypothetical protein
MALPVKVAGPEGQSVPEMVLPEILATTVTFALEEYLKVASHWLPLLAFTPTLYHQSDVKLGG